MLRHLRGIFTEIKTEKEYDEYYYKISDVIIAEDWCRAEDKNIQKNLNIFKKCAINLIKLYKSESKKANI